MWKTRKQTERIVLQQIKDKLKGCCLLLLYVVVATKVMP